MGLEKTRGKQEASRVIYDLICVGSGAAGLTAALTAAELGGRALVLEAGPRFGGVTARSAGQIWVGGNQLARAAGVADSEPEAVDYLDHLGAGLSDRGRQARYVSAANAMLAFLVDRCKIEVDYVPHIPDYWFPGPGSKAEGRIIEAAPFDLKELGPFSELVEPSPHGLSLFSSADFAAADGDAEVLGEAIARHAERGEVCSGVALSGRLVAAALQRGVELRAHSRVIGLVYRDGAVVGVEVETADGTEVVDAKAVLLATGGYDWNAGFVRRYDKLTVFKTLVQPTVRGDHITMATKIGAAVAEVPSGANCYSAGAVVDDAMLDGVPSVAEVHLGNHAIVVNGRGERFADESFRPALSGALRDFSPATNTYVNQPAWAVIDQTHRDKYPLGSLEQGAPVQSEGVLTADTIADLAVLMGVDSEALDRTVTRFNQSCAQGYDSEFGRGGSPYARHESGDSTVSPNPVLGPIDSPPYIALPLTTIGLGLPAAGLVIDESARVLDASELPIPGLYAAGNSAARLETVGYASGFAIARGLTYGFLAGHGAVNG